MVFSYFAPPPITKLLERSILFNLCPQSVNVSPSNLQYEAEVFIRRLWKAKRDQLQVYN